MLSLDKVKYDLELTNNSTITGLYYLEKALEENNLEVVKYIFKTIPSIGNAPKTSHMILSMSINNNSKDIAILSFLIEDCGFSIEKDIYNLYLACVNAENVLAFDFLYKKTGNLDNKTFEEILNYAISQDKYFFANHLIEVHERFLSSETTIKHAVSDQKTIINLMRRGIWHESFDNINLKLLKKEFKELSGKELLLNTLIQNAQNKKIKKFLEKKITNKHVTLIKGLSKNI